MKEERTLAKTQTKTKASPNNGTVTRELLETTFGEAAAPTLPDGEYELTVTFAEASLSKAGNPMVTWRATVSEGELESRSTGNQYIVLSKDQAFAGRRMVETILGEVPSAIASLRDPAKIAEEIAEAIVDASFSARIKKVPGRGGYQDSNRVLVNRPKVDDDED